MMNHLRILVTGLAKPHRGRYGTPVIYSRLLAAGLDPKECVMYRWGTVEVIIQYIRLVQPKRITAAGHSYGVSTLMMVAKALEKECVFNNIISTDGVWREKIDSPQFKSLFDGHKIKVPSNVENLYAWYQRRGIIQGHPFEVSSDVLRLWEEVKGVPHAKMDRIPQFSNMCMELMRGNSWQDFMAL